MRLETLLSGLSNPNAAVRLDVVRVLGMLDEVRALDALRNHFQQETDPAVRNAVSWAGKRLYQAQQAGYSTLDELFRHFGIDRELALTPDATEAEMLDKLQNDFEMDMTRRRTHAGRKQAGLSAAAGIGVGVMAGAGMGLSAAMGGIMAGAGSASSNLGESGRPQIGAQRTPATAPTNADISVWLKRLRSGPTPAQREQAVVELAQINNPAALPHLAATFISDASPQVRQAAQRFGKILYWSMVYWNMEQDGSLQAEMDRRLQAMGKGTKPVASGNPSAPPPERTGSQPAKQVDVGEILKKAQKGRAQRKRRKSR